MQRPEFSTTFFPKNKSSQNEAELATTLLDLGLLLDRQSGHLFYNVNFKPLSLNFELAFVRHGETYGNCGQITANGQIDSEAVKGGIKNHEKRIYQGNVDADLNQLTQHGKNQALYVAEKLRAQLLENGWIPDIILVSPLTRALDTAFPFIKQNEYQDRFFIHKDITEMGFGAWENQRVCDLPEENPCHTFYKNQNALVKQPVAAESELKYSAEYFSEVLIRAAKVLQDLNSKYSGKKILMFSHSMFGAACQILTGKGQQFEGADYLAFDGKRRDGTYYTLPNATPILMNFEMSPTQSPGINRP